MITVSRTLNRTRSALCAAAVALWLCPEPAAAAPREAGPAAEPGESRGGDAVKLWEETIVVPTYLVAPPDPNPRFYGGRVYQGAKASFYPYPVQDRLTDVREDKEYLAVFLENRYLKLCVLPEIGGRIFSAVDKTNDHDFFYRQHVIKPALIGMLGAWISGGVEWNVPHHHRATSFMPVDHKLESNADGSKTLWVGETELRHRLRWIVGLTLRPDKSYIEMAVRIFNRTPLANSILFWINPAVHATRDYQVIFPPSTEFAVQHGKPEFARWPIAREFYGGVDYTRGVDISWWKNHPAPVSFFAWQSDEDFFGGYDHKKDAGVLHVADHHVAPGKKFFEWGNGPEGEMWTKILTDEDGPYLELMAGAYSDNQPDYSWCQPYEVKTFKHYWYPVRGLGAAKNASIDAAVNLEVKEGRTATLAFNATSEHKGARVVLEANGKVLHEATVDIGPGKPFRAQVALPEGIEEGDLRASLRLKDGRELIAYQPKPREHSPLPAPVKRPAPPAKVTTSEELYLTGLRLEQLHSPAMEPAPYYEEAIRRDPGDYRANTALGILCLRQMKFAEAEARLRSAVARASENYIRPKDGEALYYLGVSLRAQGKLEEAVDSFERSAWSLGWHGAAKCAAAEIQCLRGDLGTALDAAERSLSAGALNAKALDLKAALLRKLGRHVEAEAVISIALAQDPLDFRAANERYLVRRERGGTGGEAGDVLARLEEAMRGEVQSYLELAVDYGDCGLWDEAIEVLERAAGSKLGKTREVPLVHYFLGHYCGKAGRADEAKRHFDLAAKMPPDYCFPLRFESIEALSEAMEQNPADARAPYYLGNLLYDHQPERAIKEWEKSAALEPGFAIVHRNLALAYSRVERDFPKAIAEMEKAVELHPEDPRYYYELDFLYEAGGIPAPKRLEMLTRHEDVVAQRDDAFTREIVLHIQLGEHDKAIAMLAGRKFHNWEGKSEIHDVYVDALLQRGHARAAGGKYKEALEDYAAALEFPANLEVGKPYRERRLGQVHYFLGTAHEALGETEKARQSYEDAARRLERSPSEAQYYQALALRKLGREEEARKIFDGLVEQGLEEIESASSVDYFAKFGERQTERARKAQSHFLAGIGYLGLGKDSEAREQLQKVLELDPYHLGARNVSSDGKADSSE